MIYEKINTVFKRIEKYHFFLTLINKESIKKLLNEKRQKKHPLVWILTNDTPYTTTIIEDLNKKIKNAINLLNNDVLKDRKTNNLRSKLLNHESFYDTLVELDWIDYLSQKSNEIRIEPTFPKKGYDIESKLVKRMVCFEVTSLNLSEDDRKEDGKTTEIMNRIRKIKSKFSVFVSLNQTIDYGELIHLTKIVSRKINEFTKQNLEVPSTLFYFSDTDIQEWKGYDGIHEPDDLYTNYEKYPLYFRSKDSKIKITFIPRRGHFGETIVAVGGRAKFGNEKKRIKNSIKSKFKQIRRSLPNIVILDTTFSYAGIIDVEDALFGTSQFKMHINKTDGKVVEEYWTRAKDGIFYYTKRVSAVIYYKRKILDGKIIYERKIYRNPNADIPIEDEEVQMLGEVIV